ncbi:MAG TPA: metallophosphoesterase [Pseudonocardiaceae bacterium]|nr:metallophosphoesterase [Pseudonocardiaceae bacterium]
MEESGTPTTELAATPVAPTYVIGDVHGHRAELIAALQVAGLVAEDATWSGGPARLWFLGDFFDRGDDGVAVVELVMRLIDEAAAAGGEVHALLGNHEILTLGMHRWGDTEVPADFGSRSFARSWQLNGGQDADQAALTETHLTWLKSLPVMARVGDYLLMHSDTVEYFNWGDTLDEINDAVRAVLAGEDLFEWWECWRRMTTRYAFRGPEGAEVADKVLAAFGGSQIVHGHSVIADQLGVSPVDVEGPCLYADGKVLGVDGGVFVGGPCLVVRLSPAELDPEAVIEVEDEPADDATGDTDVVAEPEAEAED